jgi:CheY-like chemotaxis protein
MPEKPSLSGRAYLVVEDEYLVALHLCSELQDSGARVLGPTSSVEDALKILADGDLPDAVILDINLRGTLAYPVADRLLEMDLPFVFVTGYDCRSIPERFAAVPCLTKPCDEHALFSLLAEQPRGEGRGSAQAI